MICQQCGREFIRLTDQMFCPFCGRHLGKPQSHCETSSGDNLSEDQFETDKNKVPPSHTSTGYCPWEDQEQLGFITGLVATLKQSLFSPTAFFSVLPRHAGLLNPLLYAMIIGTIGALGGYLSGVTFDNPIFSHGKVSGPVIVLVGLLTPVFVFFGVLLGTIFIHLSLFLVGGLNDDFEGSFRVVCYSSGPDVFNAIPMMGWFISLVWKLIITVIGLSEVHQISTSRATVAVLLPVIICCGLFFVGALALIGIWSGLLAG